MVEAFKTLLANGFGEKRVEEKLMDKCLALFGESVKGKTYDQVPLPQPTQ